MHQVSVFIPWYFMLYFLGGVICLSSVFVSVLVVHSGVTLSPLNALPIMWGTFLKKFLDMRVYVEVSLEELLHCQ